MTDQRGTWSSARRRNRTTDDIIRNIEGRLEKWERSKENERRDKYLLAAGVLELYRHIEEEKSEQSFRDSLASEGIKLKEESGLLLGLLRRYVRDNFDLANTWSEALKYLVAERIEDDEVVNYLQQNGGLTGCAEMWRRREKPMTQTRKSVGIPRGQRDRSVAIKLRPLGLRATFERGFVTGIKDLNARRRLALYIDAFIDNGMLTFTHVSEKTRSRQTGRRPPARHV